MTTSSEPINLMTIAAVSSTRRREELLEDEQHAAVRRLTSAALEEYLHALLSYSPIDGRQVHKELTMIRELLSFGFEEGVTKEEWWVAFRKSANLYSSTSKEKN